MQFNGYSYGVNMSRGSTMYYQCSVYRTKKKCKGKLIVKETGEHTCKAEPEPSVQDCDEEMRQLLETEAVKSPGVIPSRLWKKVGDQLAKKYPGQAMKPMKREEAINFINYVRKQANRGDEYRQIETFPTAIRRKLIDLRIPANQIAEAMSPGVIDVLTVIPIDEIRSKGIPYVMSIVNTKGAARIWTSFWDFFVRTWMTMFPPSLWNVNTYIEQEMEMQNRTNNPIESYNRRAKKAFGSHPTLVVFVEQAKEEAKRYLELLDDISMRCRVAPPHADPVTLSIPPAYTAFRTPKRRKVKK
ncbi:hypothetical protein PF003_g20647 [Phytophthora fragariae]|nr:hypothetical protein PF003_g20647 [Phytophthora fragariae]